MNGYDPFADVPQIEPAVARNEMQAGDAELVDVREQSEWDLGHIDGIRFIPLGDLPRRWRELDPERKWICVCRSGNRSNYAAAMLRQAGIEAANMEGGMLRWKSESLPVTHPGIIE